jgi:hypothetical protein
MRNAYKMLVRKHERKRPLRRPGTDGKIIKNHVLEIYSGKV